METAIAGFYAIIVFPLFAWIGHTLWSINERLTRIEGTVEHLNSTIEGTK